MFELILNCVINAEVCVLQPSDQVTNPEQETYGDRVCKRSENLWLDLQGIATGGVRGNTCHIKTARTLRDLNKQR